MSKVTCGHVLTYIMHNVSIPVNGSRLHGRKHDFLKKKNGRIKFASLHSWNFFWSWWERLDSLRYLWNLKNSKDLSLINIPNLVVNISSIDCKKQLIAIVMKILLMVVNSLFIIVCAHCYVYRWKIMLLIMELWYKIKCWFNSLSNIGDLKTFFKTLLKCDASSGKKSVC